LTALENRIIAEIFAPATSPHHCP